ncbi:hypothetical protein [Guptibacillus algicola]|nr:hypothetical protein [Alkalihalobacillus algicola]MCA0989289.1 hypothetical protein [Alkalihalobacillus algicola]
MGCCNPKYRETVNEEEQRINSNGKQTLPLAGKVVLASFFLFGLTLIGLL